MNILQRTQNRNINLKWNKNPDKLNLANKPSYTASSTRTVETMIRSGWESALLRENHYVIWVSTTVTLLQKTAEKNHHVHMDTTSQLRDDFVFFINIPPGPRVKITIMPFRNCLFHHLRIHAVELYGCGDLPNTFSEILMYLTFTGSPPKIT